MRTLLVESSPGSGASAESELLAAGVEVVRCHEPGASPFPCREVSERGACPLSSATRPDIVFVARSSADAALTAAESGVSCALRHGVPVLVEHDGEAGTNPFGDHVAVLDDPDRVAACEAAIGAAHDRLAAPLVAEVVRLLAAAGAEDVAVSVTIDRTGDQSRIVVTVPAGAPASDEAIAVRVHAVQRQLEADGPPSLVEVAVTRRTSS